MASIEIKLKPFVVPDEVEIVQFGEIIKDGLTIPLSEISSEALYELCCQFRNDVFKKAGKRDINYTGVRSLGL